MLSTALEKAGRWVRPKLTEPVWSSGVGLARTLLALGTTGTLIASDPSVLMSPLVGGIRPPLCDGSARFGVWCLDPGNLSVGRWLSVAVLLVVASGWCPRLTAIPHWWVAWSLTANATLQDGGDQVAAVLALLLIPIALTDPRPWHWQSKPKPVTTPGMSHVIARVTLLLIHIQAAVLYLNASVAKLGVPEWANGTAMYYWSHHPEFGSPPWLRPVTDLITYSPIGVALISWGAIALEFTLAIAIVLRPPIRRPLLVVGLLFHAFIAVHMGLVSFFMSMASLLLLYLLPVGHQLVWPHRLWTRVLAMRTIRTRVIGPVGIDG